jgi:hypothetical protein
VFPFTLVYGTDELAAVETCMSILMWWGHSWHATHPNPPVHIVDALDSLLKYLDPKVPTYLPTSTYCYACGCAVCTKQFFHDVFILKYFAIIFMS